MKVLLKVTFISVISLMLWTTLSLSQEMVEESSTNKKFPAEITFQYQDADYSLTITGVAVRKAKIFFKVYGIAHYMKDPVQGNKEEVLESVLTDGKAKQITMDFARGVGADDIRNAYRDGFKKNSTEEEIAEIQPLVDQFLGYFAKKVEENEKYILRWLPGGTIVSIVQGEEKPAITNKIFAKTLWSIWLGKDSIVDREDLVKRIIED